MKNRNTFLNEILELHPLAGIERDEPFLGNQSGLKPPSWIHDGPLYGVFLRAFSPQGTFNALRERVPYLKDLGIKTVWLMPIHPRGKKGRKGMYGSPYAIKNFIEIDPELGTEKDFKDLISAIHEQDMKIMMDMVANHCAIDFDLYRGNPDLFKKEKSYLARAWTDVYEYDYSQQAARDFMRDVLLYWVREFNIDGYRCDVAGLVPHDFWQDISERIREIKSDFFMLAEWESAKLHLNAFHATYDWSMYALFLAVLNHEKPAQDILCWVREKQNNFPLNSLHLRFTENQDLPRTTTLFGENTFYPYTALLYTVYGIPLIYAGQEIGAMHTPSLFEREPVNWDERKSEIYEYYRHLNALRAQHPALRSRDLRMPNPQRYPREVLVFEKISHDENVLVIINFSENEQNLQVPLKKTNGFYIDLMKGSEVKMDQELRIPSYSLKLFQY
jgi:cyclomaltodextrinase